MSSTPDAKQVIDEGRTSLGIEFGSTRIKACLVAEDGTTLASGGHTWENQLVDGLWTYSDEAIRTGLQAAYAALVADVEEKFGTPLTTFGAIGISAMMHGYLPFDASGTLLVPFRTWRNTNTGPASDELTRELGFAMPLRWSISHLYQAILDDEAHLAEIASFTTLAGYVHELLGGAHVLGVGDASGMFPIDPATADYEPAMVARFDELAREHGFETPLLELLPASVRAGEDAGSLSEQGARLLDPSGVLQPGVPLCPPEGDAGTGMVATGAVAPRTGNVSAGTSIFAMVVLEHKLSRVHRDLDIVTTPAGDLVAMVHCNNGASELNAWAGLFGEFAAALGCQASPDQVFAALLGDALTSDPAGGGLYAYNHLSGEPIAGLDEGRPMMVRTPDSRLTLAGFARAQLQGVFATLAMGMRTLAEEGVAIDAMYAHGGIFRTEGIAQPVLAAAINAPVAVSATAGEGGAWGMAVLGLYRRAVMDGSAAGRPLGQWLDEVVLGGVANQVVAPDEREVAGYSAFLERWERGLAAERAAAESL